MREMRVWSLGWEDALKESMAIHSSILAWWIPWIEEPGRLLSIESQRVKPDWSNFSYMQIYTHLSFCVCVCVCVYFLYMCVCVCIYIHIFLPVCVCIYNVHRYIYIYICIYIYFYTNIYVLFLIHLPVEFLGCYMSWLLWIRLKRIRGCRFPPGAYSEMELPDHMNNGKSESFIFLGSEITADGDIAMKLKDTCSLEEKLWPT